MSATDASTAIMAALSALDGFTAVTHDQSDSLTVFPAAVLALPDFGWTTYNTSLPTDATFTVYVVVKADGWALSALEAAVSEVNAALWAVSGAATTRAIPGTFQVGGAALPAYVLTVEVAL